MVQENQTAYQEAVNYCYNILPKVSRSFAIGIEFLTGDLQKSVLVGYLLCRILDTIEDDKELSWEKKESYLKEFKFCFTNTALISKYQTLSTKLTGDKFHIELVNNLDKVFIIYQTLKFETQEALQRCVIEMANGMAYFVKLYPKGIRISSTAEYKEYCYYVAGTVGILLTELWVLYGRNLNPVDLSRLNSTAVLFGEALQTVNILKDVAWDAAHENSIYIPLDILSQYGLTHENFLAPLSKVKAESVIKQMIALASKDIDSSLKYAQAIPLANFRIRFFCIFPLLLAIATLVKIEKAENMLHPEKVIKVTRKQVAFIKIYAIFASLFNFLLKKKFLNWLCH